ncbi:MAG TPA: di-heme oxidoredictase family protein [Terriglobales bacterium]|nr:di-heme oxidoredictase family protein [Terriglobales bacterium]
MSQGPRLYSEQKGTNMKAACCQPGRLFGGLVVVTVLSLALTANLTAQTAGVDPGPRPPGNGVAQATCTFILNNDSPFKFFPTVCDDVEQPPSNSPPQPPAAGAGQLIANPGTLAKFWGQALTVFSTTATVTDSSAVPPATIAGLGPSFNALSCFGCHAEPAVGGASPGIVNVNGKIVATTLGPNFFFTGVQQNPEFIAASADNATNTLPCFIVGNGGNSPCGIPLGDFPKEDFSNGPVVEVRFPKGFQPTTTPNVDPVAPGAVANLFTFQGRNDAPPPCSIGQEPITAQILAGNAIFRTPTPTFGLGFVENTPDLTLSTNLAANSTAKATLKISGTFNHSGNDQTITRFGWKAQNKSLLMFAGEASNVEMGVTNELFPNERTTGAGANCTPNNQPEDEVLGTNPNATDPSVISSVLQNNAVFMRLNAAASQCDYTSTVDNTGAPVCKQLTVPALQGQCFFGSSAGNSAFCAAVTGGLPPYGIGCVLCHSDSLTTTSSSQPGLSNFTYAPYSDFAIHKMGGDGDGVTQGQAGPTQFRTAPLWGAGQRFFFMHDGRYIDLDHAVRGHCPINDTTSANESCAVITNYKGLLPAKQTLILEFLRSL